MTGTELKQRREALGMSQRSFAEALGISRRTIEDWEAGRRTMRVGRAVEAAVRELEYVEEIRRGRESK